MKRALAILVLVPCLAAGRLDLKSGPKAGDKLEGFNVEASTGPHAPKEVDYFKEQKDAPTAYLFVNAEKFDRPMFQFLKKFDEEIRGVSDKSVAVAVWMNEKPEDSKAFLKRAEGSLQFTNIALTVFKGKSGPNKWGVNPDAHLTVVVVKDGKAVESFPFESVNATDAAKIKKVWEGTFKK